MHDKAANRWSKKFFRGKQVQFYDREAREGRENLKNSSPNTSDMSLQVQETKLSGNIEVDSAGRVTMPEEPQGPSRIER